MNILKSEAETLIIVRLHFFWYFYKWHYTYNEKNSKIDDEDNFCVYQDMVQSIHQAHLSLVLTAF